MILSFHGILLEFDLFHFILESIPAPGPQLFVEEPRAPIAFEAPQAPVAIEEPQPVQIVEQSKQIETEFCLKFKFETVFSLVLQVSLQSHLCPSHAEIL